MTPFNFFYFDLFRCTGKSLALGWRPTIEQRELENKKRLSYQRFTVTYKPY